MTDLDALFPSADIDRDALLSVHLGHHLDEVVDWPERPEYMMDGLDRELCAQLVRGRVLDACGDGELADTIAETISVVVPLASGLDEVDAAIAACVSWFRMLMEDGNLHRIVEVKRLAREVDLLDQDPSTMDDETRDAWRASVRILERHVELAELKLSLGGHEAIVIAETDTIDVMLQETPGGEDYLAVYALSYPVEDRDGDHRGDGGAPEDPDPRVGPLPDSPTLLEA